MVDKRVCDLLADPRPPLDLGATPDAELQDELELLGQVMPAVRVARLVRGQIVVDGVHAATDVGEDVIGSPVGTDLASAHMASAASLREHGLAKLLRECSPRRSNLPCPPSLVELLEKRGKLLLGRRCVGCGTGSPSDVHGALSHALHGWASG